MYGDTLIPARGGLILTNSEELYKKINSAVFPYYQGGPLEHVIAGKAICFNEALREDFKVYANNILKNTRACCDELIKLGAIVSNTENHLFLLNTLDSYNLTGKEAQIKLEEINITANKNMIPNDKLSPRETSGLRIGFAAVTTRGCNEENAQMIGELIHKYLSNNISQEEAKEVVKQMTSAWLQIEEI